MQNMNRIRAANEIFDKRAIRLKTIEAVCTQLVSLYGSKYPLDEEKAAVFLWIANETRAGIKAMHDLSLLVQESADPDTNPEFRAP